MPTRPIFGLMVLTFLIGCGPRYVQPDAATPSAELRVRSAHRGSESNNFWLAYSTETCEQKDGEGDFANFSFVTESETTVRVPAGQRFYLNALLMSHSARGTTGGVVEGTTLQCRSVASFVPEASHKYEATQSSYIATCPIQIVDAVTRVTPPTFELHEPRGHCSPTPSSPPPSNVAAGTIRAAERQNETIALFASAASKGDVEALMNALWPPTKASFGEDGWRKYMHEEILPYFAGNTGVDTYEGLASIKVQQTPAIVHFGYIRDPEGKRKPFEMVMVTDQTGTYVANLYVNRCQQGHHPICE